MSYRNLKKFRLTDRDLEFLVETGSPDVSDKWRLKQILREDKDFRMGFFKRIADICLFILGIFPDYVERSYRYPVSGEIRPQFGRNFRISPEEYEKAGQKFYKLAAEHQSAREFELSEVFWTLHKNFPKAKKPLNFIADHYLRYKRDALFT